MFLDKDIKELELSKTILDKLINKDIKVVKDLWLLKRNDLKKLNFSDSEISQIIIKLQLHGFDLNKKSY